jgi:hypothetical protein
MRKTILDEPIKLVLKEVIKRVKKHLLFIDGEHFFYQFINPEIDLILYSIEESKRNIIKLGVSNNINVNCRCKLKSFNCDVEISDIEFINNINKLNNTSFDEILKNHREERDRIKNYVKQELINNGNIIMSCVLDSL